jgi:flagellar hook-associated protein 3 FlgL
MVMRVSTATTFFAPIEAMRRQQAELEQTQKEIATGKRLGALAESPAKAAEASDLERLLAASERYAQNANLVGSRLRTGEQTLTSAIEVMQRVRELAVQGANDSLDVSVRKMIAHEVRDLSDQVLLLANRQTDTGEFLFGGTRATTAPFLRSGTGDPVTYLGDSREREIAISSSRSISDGFAGDELFMTITAGNGAFVTGVDTDNTGTGSIDTGATVDKSQWQGSTAQGPFSVTFAVSGGTTTYAVTRGDGQEVVPSGTLYRSGDPISFAGIQIAIRGAPNDGDRFTVIPASGSAATESLFTTIDRLATALETDPLTSSSRARVNSEFGSILQQLDQALGNLNDARSSLGTRIRAIEENESFRQDQDLLLRDTLSAVQDVNFPEALARLNAQMTALQVAQQAYSRISSRTLFDYL